MLASAAYVKQARAAGTASCQTVPSSKQMSSSKYTSCTSMRIVTLHSPVSFVFRRLGMYGKTFHESHTQLLRQPLAQIEKRLVVDDEFMAWYCTLLWHLWLQASSFSMRVIPVGVFWCAPSESPNNFWAAKCQKLVLESLPLLACNAVKSLLNCEKGRTAWPQLH